MKNRIAKILLICCIFITVMTTACSGTWAVFHDDETSNDNLLTGWNSFYNTYSNQLIFATGTYNSSEIDISSSPGNIILKSSNNTHPPSANSGNWTDPANAYATADGQYATFAASSGVTTNSPSTNTINGSTGWTNPDRAYDDGGTGYANITSGTPSESNTWGNYGFSLAGNDISSVKVRYDASSEGYVGSGTTQNNPTSNSPITGTPAWTDPANAYSIGSGYATAELSSPTIRGIGDPQTVSSVTPDLPAGMNANDIVILVASTIAGGSITITSDGSITPWTLIASQDVTGGEMLYAWWGRWSSGTTGPTLTPGGDHIIARTVAYSNCVTSGSPVDVSNTGFETTSDTDLIFATGLTSSINNELAIVAFSTGYSGTGAQFTTATNAALTNINERMDDVTNLGGGGGFGLDEGQLATAGSVGTWACTYTNASPKTYIAFTLKPVATTMPANRSTGTIATYGPITPALPSGVAANDIVILVASTIADGSITISNDGSVTPWTLIASQDVAGGEKLYVWWGRASGTGTSGPTLTPSGDHCIAQTVAYTNCVTTGSPLDGSAATGSETTSDTSLSFATGLTSSQNNEMAIVAFSTGYSGTGAQFTTAANANLTNITERMDDITSLNGGGGFGLDEGQLANAGSVGTWDCTYTNASSKAYIAFILKGVSAMPTFRSTGNTANSYSVIVPLPAGMSAGDIVILVASTIAGGSISIVSDGSISPWTLIASQNVANGEVIYVWWGRWSSGTTGPTLNPASDHCIAGTVAYYNCIASGNPIDVSAPGTETTSDRTFSFITGLTSSQNSELAILAFSTGNDANSTANFTFANLTNTSLSNLAERLDNTTSLGGGGGFGLYEGQKASAGGIGTWTSGTNNFYGANSTKAYICFVLKGNNVLPTFRSTGNTATYGPITPTLPSGVAANDIVILVASTVESGSITLDSTSSSIATWTLIASQDVTSGEKLYAWWGRATGTGTTGPTLTPGSDHVIARTVAYSDCVTSGSPIDGTPATGNETTSDTSLSFATGLTSTADNELAILAFSTGYSGTGNDTQFSTATNTALTNINERMDDITSLNGGGGFGLDEGQKATAGAIGTWLVTYTNNSPKAYISFVLKGVVTTLPANRSAGTSASVASTIVTPLPAGLALNDIVILTASTIAGGSITITDTGSITSWNLIASQDVSGGEKLYVWWGRWSSGSTGPTLTPAGDHCLARTIAYYNCLTNGSPIDVSATGNETTSDTDLSFATSLTSSYPNELAIVAFSTGYSGTGAQFTTATNAALTNINERIDAITNLGGGGGFGLDEGQLATAGSVGTWACTYTNASPKAYIAFVLRNSPASQIYETFNLSGSASITAAEIGYKAYATATQKMNIYTSFDAGANWTVYDTGNLPTSDPVDYTYISIFSDPNWDWTKLDNTNFKIKIETSWVSGNPTWYVDALAIKLTSTSATEYNDEIRVDVSWDGGSTWSSSQNTVLTSSETTTWYDVTNAFTPATWDATKLDNAHFKVRALAYTQGTGAEVVRLDWLAVEVAYGASASTFYHIFNTYGISVTGYNVSKVEVGVVAKAETSEEIQAQVSWDDGTSWSSLQSSGPLATSDSTTWLDFTNDAAWDDTTLNNTHFKVRIWYVGTEGGLISLDYLPVKVTKIAPSGTYASSVFNTTYTGSSWDGLFWDNTLPVGTDITFETRASDTSFLKTAGSPAWNSVSYDAEGAIDIVDGTGRYKQWRAILTTDNGSTPVLEEVRLYYYKEN